MSRPQPAIFVEEVALHSHLEFSVPPEVGTADVRAAMTSARQAATTMRGPNIVWGFSPRIWEQLSPGTLPDNVHPFEGITGTGGLSAPATQSDIWVWLQGNLWEKVWHATTAVKGALASQLVLDHSLDAFIGADNRDPIGFIDGTENPAVDEAVEISVVPDGQVGAGGVPVLVQKYVHNLAKFDGLTVHEQEDVFGRTKLESIQLDDDVMPATSHVSRNTIHDAQGQERHIYRRNTPFADAEVAGSQFIGCAWDVDRIDTMLSRMFGTAGDGLTDHFLQYSTPVTGSYYWAPSMDDLERVFGSLEADDDDDTSPAATGGSLGIGALRES
ncbi:MAG: Dyp-type peroxidase [Actinobacteria bacterium]|nr:Dyp-type peroxidase [Actinomycetota bacterium]